MILRTTGLVFLLAATAFAQAPKATTGEDVKKETAEAAHATTKYVGEKKDDFVNRMSAELKKLDGEIEKIKASTAKGAKNAEAALEKKRVEAAKKLGEVEKSTGDAWRELKADVEKAFK